ncbi:hypothetical protein CEXT_39901 [Caerostris extrusa]|uniref:Uncharacterized protein n=1 Tax=Caerostris extrusa TaxID=172846 RepID=A0AAV4SWT4_CAEEX|nr:hypothetical protein CEXT_39901 [Caerostris extrusa]
MFVRTNLPTPTNHANEFHLKRSPGLQRPSLTFGSTEPELCYAECQDLSPLAARTLNDALKPHISATGVEGVGRLRNGFGV